MYKLIGLHNFIYDIQFGFRDLHSTNHALLRLTEDKRNAQGNNTFAAGVSIDLQKHLIHLIYYYIN